MFDWISELISGIGESISSSLAETWESVSSGIWDRFFTWIYTMIYNGLADFFSMMTGIGATLFDLKWVQSALHFSLCSVGECSLLA